MCFCFIFTPSCIETEKSRTIEMTWGETSHTQLRVYQKRFKREAVSPSRPLICSVAPLITYYFFWENLSSHIALTRYFATPTKIPCPIKILKAQAATIAGLFRRFLAQAYPKIIPYNGNCIKANNKAIKAWSRKLGEMANEYGNKTSAIDVSEQMLIAVKKENTKH